MSTSEEEMVAPVHEVVEQGANLDGGAESLMERLRAERQEAIDIDFVDIALPEYKSPQLVGRYRLMDAKELNRIADKVRREFKKIDERALWGAADSLAAACIGLFARESDEDELIPLGGADGPFSFSDSRLAEYFGFNANTARKAVFEVFAHNDMALIQHNIRLSRWMTNRQTDLGDELGELL